MLKRKEDRVSSLKTFRSGRRLNRDGHRDFFNIFQRVQKGDRQKQNGSNAPYEGEGKDFSMLEKR